MIIVARVIDIEMNANRAKLIVSDGSGNIQITRPIFK
jgi:hypothetical protein